MCYKIKLNNRLWFYGPEYCGLRERIYGKAFRFLWQAVNQARKLESEFPSLLILDCSDDSLLSLKTLALSHPLDSML